MKIPFHEDVPIRNHRTLVDRDLVDHLACRKFADIGQLHGRKLVSIRFVTGPHLLRRLGQHGGLNRIPGLQGIKFPQTLLVKMGIPGKAVTLERR